MFLIVHNYSQIQVPQWPKTFWGPVKLKQPYTTDMTDFSVQLVTEDGKAAVEIFGPVTGNEPQTLLKFFAIFWH